MICNLKYKPNLGIIECTVVGPLTADEFNESAARGIALAREKGTNLFLVDDSRLEKAVKTSEVYKMPRFYADLNIDRGTKMAIILPTSPDAKKEVQFYETVCRNHGWNVAAFEQRQDALDWLMGYTPSNKPDAGDS